MVPGGYESMVHIQPRVGMRAWCTYSPGILLGIVHPWYPAGYSTPRVSWWVYSSYPGGYTPPTLVGISLLPWWVYTLPTLVGIHPPYHGVQYTTLGIPASYPTVLAVCTSPTRLSATV